MYNIYRKRKSVILSGLLGAVSFLLLYGWNILDPLNTDWLLLGGDRTQHYLGWVGYRNSDWAFPIGMMDQVTYPCNISIIFTDSIPLFAVFFKILSPFLPNQFQYFGLWGILCFILDGVISAKILKKYLYSDFQVIMGSAFFILSFQVLCKMFWHTALAGHWLILLAMYLFLYHNENSPYKKELFWWFGLGCLVSSVHIYFLLMCGIILLGFCLFDFLLNRSIKKCVGYLCSYISAAFITIGMLGGFSSGNSVTDGGLGSFSLNLNGFFNSMGYGTLLKGLPYRAGGLEGFAYLGAGILFLLLATSAFLFYTTNYRQKIYYRTNYRQISAVFICLIAAIVSLSPVISLGNHVLFTIPLPSFMSKAWGIFRASGRIVWICIYFIFIFSFCADIKICPKKMKTMLLFIALCLQLYDLSGFLSSIHKRFCSNSLEYTTPLSHSSWQELANDDQYQHLIVGADQEWNSLFPLVKYALDNELSINKFYVARGIDTKINMYTSQELQNVKDNVIYVWEKNNTLGAKPNILNYYELNSYIIGIMPPKELSASPPEDNILNRYQYKFDGRYLQNGFDENGMRHLSPSGFSFGPYIALNSGTYQIQITGKGLLNNEYLCYSGQGDLVYQLENFLGDEQQVVFNICLEESISNFEIKITNLSSAETIVEDLQIFPIDSINTDSFKE